MSSETGRSLESGTLCPAQFPVRAESGSQCLFLFVLEEFAGWSTSSRGAVAAEAALAGTSSDCWVLESKVSAASTVEPVAAVAFVAVASVAVAATAVVEVVVAVAIAAAGFVAAPRSAGLETAERVRGSVYHQLRGPYSARLYQGQDFAFAPAAG